MDFNFADLVRDLAVAAIPLILALTWAEAARSLLLSSIEISAHDDTTDEEVWRPCRGTGS